MFGRTAQTERMKVAHLILAHKNPVQLRKLLSSLQHPDGHAYVHLDRKSDAQEFAHLFNGRDVFSLEKRVSVHWAGWGTIQATINGFEELEHKGYDYINVISAQDFPIQPIEAFHQHLQTTHKEYITCESVATEWTEVQQRVYSYSFINWSIPGKFRLEALFNKLVGRRTFPLPYEIVGRSNWFTLSMEAVRYCLRQLKEQPAIARYFRYCWGADEFIFSTILYNSGFRERIVNNLVYVDWSGSANGHPKILRTEDLPAIHASGKFFARKFDANVDARVLDILEAATKKAADTKI